MRKLKTAAAVALAATMAFGLIGCGGTSASGTASSAGSTSASGAASDTGRYKVALVVKHTDAHFQRVMAGATAYAEENDITLEIQSPTSSTAYEEQMNMIETLLSNDTYDAVIISPLQSDATAVLVESSDKVVIALDTDFTSDKKTAFVGTGNEDAAKAGGVRAAELAIERGAEAPTAVILAGVQGDETHDARVNGYKEGIESMGGSVIDIQYTDALADKAATSMESIMQKYPDGVDIICSIADDMAMAAAKVISDSGSDIYAQAVICGFDGNQSAVEAVQSGALGLDVAQLGYSMGYKAVEAAVKALDGEQVDSFIDSGYKLVESSNVEDFITELKDQGSWEE